MTALHPTARTTLTLLEGGERPARLLNFASLTDFGQSTQVKTRDFCTGLTGSAAAEIPDLRLFEQTVRCSLSIRGRGRSKVFVLFLKHKALFQDILFSILCPGYLFLEAAT